MQPVDFAKTVVEFSTMIRRLLRENIAIQVNVTPDIGTVRCDPAQIQQILMNLALNAQDAMPAGGSLAINAGRIDLNPEQAAERDLEAGHYVRLVVTDNGEGPMRIAWWRLQMGGRFGHSEFAGEGPYPVLRPSRSALNSPSNAIRCSSPVPSLKS